MGCQKDIAEKLFHRMEIIYLQLREIKAGYRKRLRKKFH